MSIIISLFYNLSSSAKAKNTVELDEANPTQSMVDLIALQDADDKMPRYWSFAQYAGLHTKEGHASSNCIAMEYPMKHGLKLRTKIEEMGFAVWLIETEKGVAVVFPLERAAYATQHTRTAAVLAELIGFHELTQGAGACTFAIKPAAGANVTYIDGDVIPADFINNTFDLETGIDKWFSAPAVTKDAARAKLKSDMADATARHAPTGSFNDLFDRVDDAINSIENQIGFIRRFVDDAKRHQPRG